MQLRCRQYSVITSGGVLELTKGCYISLMRKNKNIRKQPKKIQKRAKENTCKLSFHCQKENINTVNLGSSISKASPAHQFVCADRHYSITPDFQIYNCLSLPQIDLDLDNDCDSDWRQINSGIQNLSWSLSMATFRSLPDQQ